MKNLLFLFTTVFALTCCSKDDNKPTDQLPSATQTEANTAGCYVNGELLIPKNGSQAIGGPPIYGLKVGAGNDFNLPIIGDDYWQLEIANKKDPNSSGIILWKKICKMVVVIILWNNQMGNYIWMVQIIIK